MERLRSTAIAAILLAQFSLCFAQTELSNRATCKVHCQDPRGGWFQGSGTYIGGRIVLTAHHVCRDGILQSTYVQFGNTRIETIGYLRSVRADVLALELESEPPVEPVKIASGPADRVYGLGFSGRNGFGMWTATRNPTEYNNGADVFYDGDWAEHGDSGGGAFNMQGEYVGTVSGTNGESVNCSSWEETVRFLKAGKLWDRINSGELRNTRIRVGQCLPGQPCPPQQVITGGTIGNAPTPSGISAQPGGCTCSKCRPVTPQTIEIDLQALADELASRPELVGPAGPQGLAGSDGLPGLTGPAGPAGPSGPAGQDAEIDYDALAEAMADRLPPITFVVRDPEGNVVDQESAKLGGKIDLQLQVQ